MKTISKLEERIAELNRNLDEYRHEWNTAKKLGFSAEERRIEIDISWTKAHRNELQDIKNELQKELQKGAD